MQVAGHNVNKKKTELVPFTYYTTLQRWEQTNLYPMCILMNYFQVVRLMLLTQRYCLSYKWVSGSSQHGAPAASVQAMRSIDFHMRRSENIDVFDVVTVMTSNKFGPGTAAGEMMTDRRQMFDNISVQDAMMYSRKLLQAMQTGEDDPNIPVAANELPELERLHGADEDMPDILENSKDDVEEDGEVAEADV